MVAKPVAGEAVLPSIDQTRTSGLVTLPGAFVGLRARDELVVVGYGVSVGASV